MVYLIWEFIRSFWQFFLLISLSYYPDWQWPLFFYRWIWKEERWPSYQNFYFKPVSYTTTFLLVRYPKWWSKYWKWSYWILLNCLLNHHSKTELCLACFIVYIFMVFSLFASLWFLLCLVCMTDLIYMIYISFKTYF